MVDTQIPGPLAKFMTRLASSPPDDEPTGMANNPEQNLSRTSRGTLTVKWAGSRDKIFSPSGRGGAFFLTSLFIELIDPDQRNCPDWMEDGGRKEAAGCPGSLLVSVRFTLRRTSERLDSMATPEGVEPPTLRSEV